MGDLPMGAGRVRDAASNLWQLVREAQVTDDLARVA